MNRPSRGFTLIEVLVALMIGAILTSMALKGFGATSSFLAARQSKNVFSAMVARARAHAIESGSRTMLVINTAGDSIVLYKGVTRVENVRFGEEMGVDIQGPSTTVTLCMNPRGFAETGCNSFHSAITLKFVQGAQIDTVRILPLGQLRW